MGTAVKKEEKLPNLEKALHMVGSYYVEEVKTQLKADGTYSTGKLSESIAYELVNGSIDIVNTTYGKAIDEGSNPAKQGWDKVSKGYIDNIIEWASAKGIRPRSGSMRKMANAIARSIKKKGIVKKVNYSGSNVFDRVYKKLEERIGADITEGYAQDIKNKLNKL